SVSALFMNCTCEASTENIRPTDDFDASSITTVLSLAALFAGYLLTPSANAQITSTLSGRVLDPEGLGISGVLLLARSNQLGVDRYTERDGTGAYEFSGLLAGIYEISVSKAGFAKQT